VLCSLVCSRWRDIAAPVCLAQQGADAQAAMAAATALKMRLPAHMFGMTLQGTCATCSAQSLATASRGPCCSCVLQLLCSGVRTSESAAVPVMHRACLPCADLPRCHSPQLASAAIACSTGRHVQGQVMLHSIWASRQMTSAHPPVDMRKSFVEHGRSKHLA
jgi:hypothetical protein